MNGVSLHWFRNLFEKQMVGDFAGSLQRSLILGVAVMLVTVVASFSAGLAFRSRFRGSAVLFYLAIASLIVPSILISLGIGLLYRVLGWDPAWYSSAFGAHLTWTLPFGLLIMFAVFNRFDRRYEEAARDLGATSWQTIRHVVVPILLPSLIGVGLFGFTLSYDEFARSLYTAGTFNTLPLEIYGMTTNVTTPVLYALGTVTTGVSFVVIALSLLSVTWLRRRGRVMAAMPERLPEMIRRARVLRLPTAGPQDTAPLAAAIASGDVDPATIVAIVGKTEGNGCVNDFTRGYATLALKLLLAEAWGVRGRNRAACGHRDVGRDRRRAVAAFAGLLPGVDIGTTGRDAEACHRGRPDAVLQAGGNRPGGADRGDGGGGDSGNEGCRHRRAVRRAFRPDQVPAPDQGTHRGGRPARRLYGDRGHLSFDGTVARRLGAGCRPCPG